MTSPSPASQNDLTTDALVDIWRTFGAFERDQVCCGTVTVQQCLVLQALRAKPSTLSELSAAHGASPSSMTRLVDGLVKRGWVSRHREGKDRRRAHVALTDEGRTEADRLHRLTRVGVEDVMERIPAAERATVERALELVRDALKTSRESGVGCC